MTQIDVRRPGPNVGVCTRPPPVPWPPALSPDLPPKLTILWLCFVRMGHWGKQASPRKEELPPPLAPGRLEDGTCRGVGGAVCMYMFRGLLLAAGADLPLASPL